MGIVICLSCIILSCVSGGLILACSLWGRELAWGDAAAIVRVEGVITAGSGPIRPFGGKIAYSERVVEHLRRAQDDPSVKAVVLRVDSPGGGVVASDEIYREIVGEAFALP